MEQAGQDAREGTITACRDVYKTKGKSMSQPNEPRFEDDFFNEPSDDDPYEQETTTLDDIAVTKAWNYTLEYDSNSGMVSSRAFSTELKEAYKAGFLEGFAHRFTQPTIEREEE